MYLYGLKNFNVPKQLWNKKGPSLLASTIDKPLFMDTARNKCSLLQEFALRFQLKRISRQKIKVNTNNVIFIPLEFTWKALICIDCQMFGHSKAGCERQLPKSKPKNNTITKENVGNSEKRHVQQWKRKETKSAEGTGSAELSNIVITSSTPQQVLSQRVIDSGSNSLPAHGSQGRLSTTIVSNQEIKANLLESPPILVNKHHHMYEALVDTNEAEYPYAINEKDSNEKEIENVFNDHIIPDTTNRVEGISSQSVEVGYENMATTPLIYGDEWRTAVKPKKSRKQKQCSPSGIDDPTIAMMKKASFMARKKVKHLDGYIKEFIVCVLYHNDRLTYQ
ncbi:hypothetical protein IFM89_003897 [Coptis chinensis]|uniref:DUF4283 domain-containing protein n=1 Tax=Coptis chinensis TaxID=261450 RepID=A0A835I1H9_9MAGN|nr:hypothetical protein IFM89_003897 [Coptis chinensis]